MTVTNDMIWAELGNPGQPTGPDLTHLDLTTAAVNAYVGALPVGITPPWADNVTWAAVLLGARLFTRRNSPNGIINFEQLGSAYVAKYDADISRHLQIDKFAPGVVA